MFVTGTFLQGSVGLGELPASGLLIDCGHAAALIAVALAVCCGCLWLLSRPGDPDAPAAARTGCTRLRSWADATSGFARRSTGPSRQTTNVHATGFLSRGPQALEGEVGRGGHSSAGTRARRTCRQGSSSGTAPA